MFVDAVIICWFCTLMLLYPLCMPIPLGSMLTAEFITLFRVVLAYVMLRSCD